MDYLPVLFQPFRSGSNLTPSDFANNTSLITPWIIELSFPSDILLSFQIFKMMPPFYVPRILFGCIIFIKKTDSTVYLTENAWSKRDRCLLFPYLKYWLTSKIDDGAQPYSVPLQGLHLLFVHISYFLIFSWRYSFLLSFCLKFAISKRHGRTCSLVCSSK